MEVAQWGLIPEWVKEEERALSLWNSTLIARGESMFEKPSFREASISGRCILPVDGFFEHFHQNKKTYPHYIQRKDGKRLFIGALKNDWTHPLTGIVTTTFAIVTTKANAFMTKIHNNPKVPEARMPFFVEEHNLDLWMNGDPSEVESILVPDSLTELTSKTVRPLRGKLYVGNCAESQEAFEYAELNESNEKWTLFD